ncbi:MAG TPA: M56 family metallopeptidase [Chitinophagaceae bacterium]|jgi:beta-lactamase regulating signal transducer with metallopeptidase domain|nr:M56 family metallopeptidase [Chitinophagaceae bacterium]
MQVILKALSWTFLHSLWQGLLAALLAAVIISVTKKATARLRYNLLGTVVILFLAAALITFSRQFQLQEEQLPLASLQNVSTGDNSLLSSAGNSSSSSASTGFIDEIRVWFNSNAGSLMLVWSVLFLLNCLKLFTGLATVRRLRHYKTYPVTIEWKEKILQLQTRLGIRRSVELLQSGLVKVPVALGILRPVILVPVGLLSNIPPEQAEAILLHELSHIRRKDYLVNLLQRFADAVFFFNPGFLWVSSLLRQEREACCDDIAVANTGQKRNYIDALVSFQEYSLSHSLPVMAIGSKRQYLLNRVKRIITSENKRLDLFEKLALFSGLILFCAFTVISKTKKEIPPPVSIYLNRLPTIDAAAIINPEKLNAKPVTQPVKKERNRSGQVYKPVTDTIPVKKDSVFLRDTDKKTAPSRETKWEDAEGLAKQTLLEIEKIKEKIGRKKEEIGVEKAKLNTQGEADKNTATKTAETLEKKRRELDADRAELDRKRSEWENYKKKVQENNKPNDPSELKPKQISMRKEQMEYSPAMTEKEKENLKKKIKNNIGRTEKPRTEYSRKQSYQPETELHKPAAPTHKNEGSANLFDYTKKQHLFDTKKINIDSAPTIKNKLFTLKSDPKSQENQFKLDQQWKTVNQSEWEPDAYAPKSQPKEPPKKEAPSAPGVKKKAHEAKQTH